MVGAENYVSTLEARQSSDFRNVSQARGPSLGCLPQAQRPESESLSWLCLLSVDRSTAGDHVFLEDTDQVTGSGQIGNTMGFFLW